MKGVYPRTNSVQIYFQFEGKTCRETLTGSDGKPLPPTPKNVTYADKVRQQILRDIALGTFRMDEYFPHSKTVGGRSAKQDEQKKPQLVKDIAESWLYSRSKTCQETSMRAYRSAIQPFIKALGDKQANRLTFNDIDTLMSDLAPNYSAITYNTILTEIRGFFKYAAKIGVVTENPAIDVTMKARPDPSPDPLKPEEAAKVLADMRKHYHPGIANYFDLAFLLGFRPSEGIDLKWENVDWEQGVLVIDSARVWGIHKDTKTHKVRRVELGPMALAVLEHQKALTLGHEHGRIFENPVSGKQWYMASRLHADYWVPSLKRCELKPRDSRQTRHSCASHMLMSGRNPAWAARQLGHSVQIFTKVYATWIDKADKGEQRDGYETFLMAARNAQKSFTEISLSDVSR